MMLYRRIAKPILFKMDPERAHHLTIEGLKKTSSVPGAIPLLRKMYGFTPDPRLKTKVCDISFPHPIGLAAGLDKNGQVVKGFSSIGFGFVEVGTVTPKPQPGNDLPRLFRLPEDQALINRMGFNNLGTAQMAKNLTEAGKYTIPVAVNIGKNKTTPNTEAESDYRKCIQDLYDYGTFFVVNISSPNTPDLRKLQHGEELYRLLSAVTDEMDIQRKKRGEAFKPIFVKIAPDLNEEEMKDIIEIISRTRISGIIATNTTLSREGLRHHHQREAGGLSGRPLTKKIYRNDSHDISANGREDSHHWSRGHFYCRGCI